jgi:4-hydroxy-tetrahydrodipicolinate synthase
MFKGSMVALVTPFKDGKIDEDGLGKLIDWHISEGTNAIIPCGTTGEASTLDYDEHLKVIELTVRFVNKRVPVIAGTGANSTAECLMLTEKAKQLKADAALLVTPYYNKPTQEGLYQHYEFIAKKVDIPIVLYNVPTRTGVNMLPSTVARLAKNYQTIVGVKEASANMQQVSQVIALCRADFDVISGDDFTTLPLLALGGKGVISVVANIVPKEVSMMCKAWEDGNINQARQIHFKIDNLNSAMFIETNPIPVKTALNMMGKIQEEFRLPLCSMSPENKEKLKNSLLSYGLQLL